MRMRAAQFLCRAYWADRRFTQRPVQPTGLRRYFTPRGNSELTPCLLLLNLEWTHWQTLGQIRRAGQRWGDLGGEIRR